MGDDKKYTVKGLLRLMKKPDDVSRIGNPVITIDLDNYKPYSDIKEMRKKAAAYLGTLKNKSFEVGERNKDIKFKISERAIRHILYKAGETKIAITRHFPEIFKQIEIEEFADETKGDTNTESILIASVFVMIKNDLYKAEVKIKIKKNGENDLYDVSINNELPEKEKTE